MAVDLVEPLTETEREHLVALLEAARPLRVTANRCAGCPPSWWAPEEGEQPAAEHLALCRACPARLVCLTLQMRSEHDGVRPWIWFGGYGPADRDDLARAIGMVAVPLTRAEDRRARVERLAALGYTRQRIADEVGVCRKTITRDLAAMRREIA